MYNILLKPYNVYRIILRKWTNILLHTFNIICLQHNIFKSSFNHFRNFMYEINIYDHKIS